jgi:hypothetical protein
MRRGIASFVVTGCCVFELGGCAATTNPTCIKPPGDATVVAHELVGSWRVGKMRLTFWDNGRVDRDYLVGIDVPLTEELTWQLTASEGKSVLRLSNIRSNGLETYNVAISCGLLRRAHLTLRDVAHGDVERYVRERD